MSRTIALLFALIATATAAPAPDRYAAEIAAFDAEHSRALQDPEGWLSLVGLHWLTSGEQRIGRAADNDIRLATGPAQLGRVRLDAGQVMFTPAAGVDARLGDTPVSTEVLLPDDHSDRHPRLYFADGHASLEVLLRGGRLGLRVRDSNAPALRHFHGLRRFAVDPGWRVAARFEANPEGSMLDSLDVLGDTQSAPNPGVLVFQRDGREYRLQAIGGAEGPLFVPFGDRSNGHETYGGGRWLYVERPVDGHTVIDFNRAFNPPCAYTGFATCPLAPVQNRLDLAVTAGEQRYADH